jgi:hypothetical protein
MRKTTYIFTLVTFFFQNFALAEYIKVDGYKPPSESYYQNLLNQYPALGSQVGVGMSSTQGCRGQNTPEPEQVNDAKDIAAKEAKFGPNFNQDFRFVYAGSMIPIMMDFKNKKLLILDQGIDQCLSSLGFTFRDSPDIPILLVKTSINSRLIIIENREYFIGRECPGKEASAHIYRYGLVYDNGFKVAFKTLVKRCVL